ncbi:MAG: fibronectin type III-like domain-contianing protein, partial [Chloroflexota bacterium]|nr:fibronectin type III-like domain-contianing protein [Chloroflexota bacterium]
VVQLYARDEEASVGRPILELVGFRRVSLAPGERVSVSFHLWSEQFAYTGIDYRRVVEPGGKLPVTFVRDVGQVPLTYRHHPSGGRSQWKGDYVDGTVAPLWPFGFGRSYTSFEVSNLRADRSQVPTDGGELVVTVEVANVGDRPGDEVVQLYARDEEASVGRPILELVGFRRVSLAPGERVSVSFHLWSEQFAYTGIDYRRVVEPGGIGLSVGTSSADLPLTARVELVGPVVEVIARRRYVTESSLG